MQVWNSRSDARTKSHPVRFTTKRTLSNESADFMQSEMRWLHFHNLVRRTIMKVLDNVSRLDTLYLFTAAANCIIGSLFNPRRTPPFTIKMSYFQGQRVKLDILSSNDFDDHYFHCLLLLTTFQIHYCCVKFRPFSCTNRFPSYFQLLIHGYKVDTFIKSSFNLQEKVQ